MKGKKKREQINWKYSRGGIICKNKSRAALNFKKIVLGMVALLSDTIGSNVFKKSAILILGKQHKSPYFAFLHRVHWTPQYGQLHPADITNSR